jgi:hypothetical protein
MHRMVGAAAAVLPRGGLAVAAAASAPGADTKLMVAMG